MKYNIKISADTLPELKKQFEKQYEKLRSGWLKEIQADNSIPFINRKIEDITIKNPRLRNFLLHGPLNIKLVSDILEYNEEDLLEQNSFGLKCLSDLEELLNKNGLSLQDV